MNSEFSIYKDMTSVNSIWLQNSIGKTEEMI